MDEPQFLTLLLFCLHTSAAAYYTCPAKCSCSPTATLYKVDCSNKNLQEVPDDIPGITGELLLNGNNIISLRSLSIYSLEILNISHNKLESIAPSAFKRCSRLRVLDLGNNMLTDTNFPPAHLFTSTPGLQELILRSNKFYFIPNVSDAIGLETLDLFDNKVKNTTMPNWFASLRNMKTLNLGMNPLSETISNTSFSAFTTTPLKNLYLFKNKHLKNIEAGAFNPINGLETLEFAYNNRLDAEALQKFLCNIKMPNLKRLILDHMNIPNSPFFPQLTACLAKFPIDALFMSKNLLRILKTDDFKTLGHLETLGLEGNLLYSIDDGVFSHLASLRYLYLTQNNLKTVPKSLPSGLSSLQLDMNVITEIKSKDFYHLMNLHILYLNHNEIKSIDAKAFTGLRILKKLSLANNPIQTLHEELFTDLEFLQQLDLQNVNLISLRETPGLFSSQQNLQTLQLSGNKINSVDVNSFQMKSLKLLTLLSNNFGEVFKEFKDQSFKIFEGMPALEVLDLGHNGIENPPRGLLAGNPSLTSVMLYFNALTEVPGKVFSSKQLIKYLAVNGNNIATVRIEDIPVNLKTIDLTGNQFLCTCSLLEFQKWLKGNKTNVVGKNSLRCGNPPEMAGQLVLDFNPGKCSRPENRYQGYITIVAPSLAGILVILLIVVGVVTPQKCRIYRFTRMVEEGLNELNNPQNEEHRPLMQPSFSSYFCYSEDAEPWVRAYITPNANESVFTQDSIQAGQSMWTVRKRALTSCRVAVVVLTHGLSQDYLAEVELHGILTRCRQEHRRESGRELRVILVRISPTAMEPWIFSPAGRWSCFRFKSNLSNALRVAWEDYSREGQRHCLNVLRENGVELRDE